MADRQAERGKRPQTPPDQAAAPPNQTAAPLANLATAPGTAVWDAGHRLLTIGLLLVISITAFEAMAVATVLPATAEDLGGQAAIRWYGWVFSGFMLANLVGIPAAGRLADRGGPLRPFVFGSVVFAAGLLIAGLAPSMPLLVLGRVAQGLGAGALSSIAYVAVARGYQAADQPRMLALLSSAWVIPGVLGPSAAAALAHQLGWRSVFLLLVPMTIVSAALAMKGLGQLARAGEGSASSDISIGAALQLALGAAVALLATEASGTAASVACVVAGTAVALPALVRLLPAGTLRAAPGAPAALAAKGLVTFAFFGAEAFLPLALTSLRGESMVTAGLALTAGTLGWTSGAWVQERLSSRVPRVRLVRAGLGLVALGVAGAAGVLVVEHPGPVAMVSWALAGIGIGISYSTTTLLVFEGTPPGGEGNAASALQLANVLGVAFGTGMAGAVVGVAAASGLPQDLGIGLTDALMVAAALLGLLVAGRCSGAGPVEEGTPRLQPRECPSMETGLT